ncbi:MAG: glutaredoxin domain-containing protein, partial [Oscillospiraceae bacterium]
KERRLYDAQNSVVRPIVKTADCDCQHPQHVEGADGLTLFVSKTCPNCKIAKAELDKAGASYSIIDVEDRPELTKSYKINKAPTLISVDCGVLTMLTNASEIKRFLTDRV